MSALSIQIPYPIFSDRDGQPLENGYVWIGQPYLDPQTNPVQVYLDDALSIPAAQPLRTIGGYVSNSGTPAQLYIDGVNFSIRVQDNKGTQVYYFPDGSGINPDAAGVTYNPAGLGAVPTTVQAKLRETVSVFDFMTAAQIAAVQAGTSTGDTAAIQAALDVGGHIIFPLGEYRCDTVYISKDTYIDFQSSTVKRYTAGSGDIFQSSAAGNLTMRNGTIDGDNTAANRGMLLQYNDSNGALVLENMTWQNNCKFDAPNDPTKSQDTDLVYVLNAASVEVDNCRFKLASRQGISFVGVCPYSSITNSTFEDCYLFGVDYEPNTPATHMYEQIIVNGCVFKNNGPKNPVAGNYVWNSGGAMLVASGASVSTQLARNITFSNNQIISTDFLNAEVAWVEPFLRFDQYQTINFTGNLVDNLGFVNFGAFTTIDIEESVIVGNTFKVTGGQENSIAFNRSLRNIVSDNVVTTLTCKDGVFTISGNDFTEPSAATGITLTSTCLETAITGNIFDNKTTVVNASAMTNGWTFVGNTALNFTTLYSGPPTDQAGNRANSANLGNVTRRSSGSFLPISVIQNSIGYSTGRGAGHRFDIGFDSPLTKTFGGALIGAVNAGGSGSGNADFVVQVATGEVLSERVRVRSFDGGFIPTADGTQPLGLASNRWSEVFAVAPAINTSDEREKQQVSNISDAERRVAIAIKSKLCKFKFNDAVDKKGDGARWHFGVLAQDIGRAFEAEGLDASAYGMFCHDTWEAQEEVLDEEGNIINHAREVGDRYGVRYEELFAFVLSAI